MVAVWTASVATTARRAELPGSRQLAGGLDSPPSRAAAQSSSQQAIVASTADLRRVLDKYCVGCHNQRANSSATASGVILDGADSSRVADEGAMWEKVIRKLRAGAMPPAGMPRPDAATAGRAGLVSRDDPRPRGGRTIRIPAAQLPHRLNRAEYANAIRDLLALEVDPSTLLPPDDSADGFDNNADVLGVSPSLLERYLSAAAKISALAVGDPTIVAGFGDLSHPRRRVADRPERGAAARDARRPDGAPHVPARRRVHHQGQAARDQPRRRYAASSTASARGHRRRRARAARAGRRPTDYTQSSLNATNVVNSLAERLQVRVDGEGRPAAGRRRVSARSRRRRAANRLQSFLRSTLIATDHPGLPHVENITVTGPFNSDRRGETPSRRRVCSPALRRRRQDERPCARTDRVDAGAARLPAAGDRRRTCSA